MTKFTKRLGETVYLSVWETDTISVNAVHLSSCFREPSLLIGPLQSRLQSFLQKQVCDARGNVFSLFHSITFQSVQDFLSNTIHASFLQENQTILTAVCILLISYSKHSNEYAINLNACFRQSRHGLSFMLLFLTNWETCQLNMHNTLVPTVQKVKILFTHSSFLLHNLQLEKCYNRKIFTTVEWKK